MSVYPPGFGDRPSGPWPDEQRGEARALFWKRLAIGALLVGVVSLLGVSTVTIALIRQAQLSSRSTLEAVQRGNARIEECTTAGRPCYDKGQQQAAREIANLIQGNRQAAAAAASCAARLPSPGFWPVYRCELSSLQQHKGAAP